MSKYNIGNIVQFLSCVFSIVGIVVMARNPGNPGSDLGPILIAVGGIALAVGTKIKYAHYRGK